MVYRPTARVLTVLALLQSHGRMTGAQLARRLEVDIRTVRNYVETLIDLGIPVEAERGRYGAYRLAPGFKLPPLLFSEDEALALTLGLKAARRMGLALTAPAVEGALAKVERVLPGSLRTRVQAVEEAVLLHLAPPRDLPAQALVLTLSTAVQEQRQVLLRHRSAQGEETERRFDPYGLVYRAGRWYAAGHCHLREAVRVFRLDRISSVEMRDETFTRPLDFDCVDYVMRSLSTTPTTWPVEILLETTLAEAQEVILPAVATLEETGQGVMMRCSVGNLAWLAESLLTRLEWPFIVVQPPELCAELHKLAARIERMASRSLPEA